MTVLIGVKETLRALDQLDHKAKLGIDKAIRLAAADLVAESKGYIDPDGLKGWGNWRGGYTPSSIERGIKVKRGGSRKRGSVTQAFVSVVNANPAGSIWEVAGRRSNGQPPRPGRNPRGGSFGNGRAMIAALNRRRRASRTVWAAAENTDMAGAQAKVRAALDDASRIIQASINRA